MIFGEMPPIIKGTKIGEKIGRDDYFFEREDNQKEFYLKNILRNIKNPEAKEFLLDSSDGRDLQAVLYGIKPACWIAPRIAELMRENIALSDNFVIKDGVVFNKRLVAEIAKNNPDIFLHTESDAEKIIDYYFFSKEKGKSQVHVGMLLGYPKKSSEDFERFHNKTKNLDALECENIITENSPDWKLFKKVKNAITEFQNEAWEAEGECPLIPSHIKEEARYLLYKYLPKDLADLSWEQYQGKRVNTGGIVWIEWQLSAESDELKRKYRSLFNDPGYRIAAEEEMDNLCRELVNENVAKTLDEKNIVEIKNLARHIKSKYSNMLKRISLHGLLSGNYNSIDGQPINSADDLIQYLKMQQGAYEKEAK